MKIWTLSDARHRLDDLVRRALACGSQRVSAPGGEVVVLSAREYDRLAAGTRPAQEAGAEPRSLLDLMQTSPLAEAMAAGDIDLQRYPDWPRATDD